MLASNHISIMVFNLIAEPNYFELKLDDMSVEIEEDGIHLKCYGSSLIRRCSFKHVLQVYDIMAITEDLESIYKQQILKNKDKMEGSIHENIILGFYYTVDPTFVSYESCMSNISGAENYSTLGNLTHQHKNCGIEECRLILYLWTQTMGHMIE